MTLKVPELQLAAKSLQTDGRGTAEIAMRILDQYDDDGVPAVRWPDASRLCSVSMRCAKHMPLWVVMAKVDRPVRSVWYDVA
jgi:hypothetical protein